MIKQSRLIEVFRATHNVVEDWLHLKHRTWRHQSKDMVQTLQHLSKYMAEGKAHVFKQGRTEIYCEITDAVAMGLHILRNLQSVRVESVRVEEAPHPKV